jgi:putative endonuclease
MRTPRQASGDAAEGQVAALLASGGWTIVGRQVHAGRGEIDVIAVDPGPPRALVFVEVRWRARRDFGLGEETVDHRKRAVLHRAAWRWLETAPPELFRLAIRFDLIAVEPGEPGRPPRIRHHRAAF